MKNDLFVLVAEPVIVRADDRARAIQMYRNYLTVTPYTVRLAACVNEDDADAVLEQITAPVPDVDDAD